MDSALACFAGGLGLNPAVSKVDWSCYFQMIFLPLRSKEKLVGKKWNQK